MKEQFLISIIFAIILYFMPACSKSNEQTEQAESQNSKNEFAENYREKIKTRTETTKTTKTTEQTKKTIEKTNIKLTEKSVQEKINNLKLFSINDLLSPAEIALLSPEDIKEYKTKLINRVFDSTEKISLDIYNYMKDTGLLNLCDKTQKYHLFRIAAAYINNQGKGFDKIYEMYDEYLQNNNLELDELFWVARAYIKYLNDSQDYQKWQELLNGSFKEIADSFKNNYNIGKMTEPFQNTKQKYKRFYLMPIKTQNNIIMLYLI